jgi:hypothetical protein
MPTPNWSNEKGPSLKSNKINGKNQPLHEERKHPKNHKV